MAVDREGKTFVVDRRIIAGKAKYGCWRADVPTDTFSMEDALVKLNSNKGDLTVLDAGCGNGHSSWQLLANLATSHDLRVHYLDIQPDAIDLTKIALSEKPLPNEAQANFHVHDLTQFVPLPYESVDIALLDHVLHWSDAQNQQEILRNIWATLVPWGYAFIGVCSVFNAANIGRGDRVDRSRAEQFLQGDAPSKPLTRFHKGFGRDMHFFSEPYLSNLLKACGYRLLMGPRSYKNQQFPNHWGPRHAENIFAVAQKV